MIYGFILNILDGIDDSKKLYKPSDLSDIDYSISLLAMYCYRNDVGACVALPFKNNDDTYHTELLRLYNIFKENKESANALAILSNKNDRRWKYAQAMYQQLLIRLEPVSGTLTGYQAEIFNIALEAWNVETNSAPLNEPR